MKVGEYVRTKDGVIAKITDIIVDFSIDCDRDVFDLNELAMMEIPWYFKDEYILKSSPNIIDLIEENDLIKYRINGDLYVSEVEGVPIFDKYKLSISYADTIIFLEELDIVSVVTREQFESMEYRVNKK